jgi:copper homeostasis protein
MMAGAGPTGKPLCVAGMLGASYNWPVSHILVETCVQTVESAVLAARCGADRLELCAALAVGGVTPGPGLLRAVRTRIDLPLQVLIRPRAGDDRADAGLLEAMRFDIAEARRAGADGVVVGVLTADRSLDRVATARLIEAARPLTVTFHRAVDRTPDLGAAVATLVELGVDRVLTAGGAEGAEAGLSGLAGLMRRFGPAIVVLAGGRVRADNVRRIIRESGVREVHLGPTLPGNGELDGPELVATIGNLARER